MVWISSHENRRSTGIVSLAGGIVILLFSPFIASLIGIFLSSLVLIVSLLLLGFGVTMKRGSFMLPIIIMGVVGFFLGMAALLYPDLAVSALGIILGIWMFLFGLGQLTLASSVSYDRLSYLLVLLAGTLTVIVGLFLILSPVQGMEIMVVFFGCYLVVLGILTLIRDRSS
jgi:uncharacterized membrane protein HdeD (DUF308 family)